jgi:hypothetical protein
VGESFSPPPAWVYQRDGRLVPFEADRISQSLFAATERLGRPDAFLARELTDGVLHFLAAEADSTIPTTTQIAELVVKVVRELGQPALAQVYHDHVGQPAEPATTTEPVPAPREDEIVVRFAPGEPLDVVRRACLRAYTLKAVFTRDLVAAQGDGLLTLTGLEHPHELAACVVTPPRTGDRGLVESLEAVRNLAGGVAALDGPEYVLWHGGRGKEAVSAFVRELGIGLRATGLRAVINLNSAMPPAWADELADGPLFAGQRPAPEPERLAGLVDALLEELHAANLWAGTEPRESPVRVDWHLGSRDFQSTAKERLLRLARWALEGRALAFVFDRPRRPVPLAEGLDRQHPALLLLVGLHLPRLAAQPGLCNDPSLFLLKLGSLARLALSAASQKRDYLRRHGAPALAQGFLLDRARLAVAPVGLEQVVRLLLGRGLCADATALELGRQIVGRLGEVLHHDGRQSQREACLDAPADFSLGDGEAGLTAWDATVPVKNQLRAAGVLHATAGTGTAAVLLPEESVPAAEQVVSWLRGAWQQTDVVRVRFLRAGRMPQQLTFGGEG